MFEDKYISNKARNKLFKLKNVDKFLYPYIYYLYTTSIIAKLQTIKIILWAIMKFTSKISRSDTREWYYLNLRGKRVIFIMVKLLTRKV